MSYQFPAGRHAAHKRAESLATAILDFIRLDRARLNCFLEMSGLSHREFVSMKMTRWLIICVLQHVVDNEDLREQCVEAGVFRGPLEGEALMPSATAGTAEDRLASPVSKTVH